MPIRIVGSQKDVYQEISAGNPAPITKAEYEQGIADFDNYFKAQTIKNKGAKIPILKNDLVGFISLGRTQEEIERSVLVFYYGYDVSTAKLMIGLRVVTHSLDFTNNVFTIDPDLKSGDGLWPTHELVPGTEIVDMDGVSRSVHRIELAQKSKWQVFRGHYFEHVFRHLSPKNPQTPNYKKLNENDDPKAIYFPYWNEIKVLQDLNQQNEPTRDVDYLVISDYAPFIIEYAIDVIKGGDGYYHSLSLHTAYKEGNNLVELLEPGSAVTVVKRAIDYGHLCPPRCKDARLNRN